MQIESVIKGASKRVTPAKSEERKLAVVSSQVSALLEREFEKNEVKPVFALGGSYAKGTWLKGSVDIDFFLLFPVDYPRERLEGEAIESCRRAVSKYKIEMRYAEHPYVEAFVDNVRVNVVPCYKVDKGNWQSAADRSPFHAEYIRSRFDDKLKLEARLLKKFVKCSGVYGAEVKIQGFSGYVCEVFTLKYRSFLNALENLSKMRPGQMISLEDYDSELSASFKSSLIILDPVDTTRNLGSAISTENVAKLALNARRFLSRPAISYFEESSWQKVKAPNELLSRTIVVTFRSNERSVDILWGQLKKSARSLASKLEGGGYTVLRETAASDEKKKCAFIFLLLETRIGCLHAREGPEYFREKEVERYVEKNKARSKLTWINKEGRVISLAEREASRSNAVTFLNESLSDKKKLEKLGLSKAVKEEIMQGFRIDLASKLMKKKEPWLVDGIYSILTSERDL
ncbi:MAG: CCA tRNA nucleotidyltransferase [Nitrososphaerales archaeon]